MTHKYVSADAYCEMRRTESTNTNSMCLMDRNRVINGRTFDIYGRRNLTELNGRLGYGETYGWYPGATLEPGWEDQVLFVPGRPVRDTSSMCPSYLGLILSE